jgi:hypothetical protein
MGRGPHVLERPCHRGRDRRAGVSLHEAGVRRRRHPLQRRRPAGVAAPPQEPVEERTEQAHAELIGHPLHRPRGDGRDRMGAVAEIREGHREGDLPHLVGADARLLKRRAGCARAGRTGARLAPPEGHGRHRARREIRPCQVLLDALYARPAHALGPQHPPHRGVAEAARVLLAHHQRHQVHHAVVEAHQEPVLRMQIDQRPGQPGDRGEVADGRVGHALSLPGPGLQGPVPV